MSRGLSKQQLRILGLAYTFNAELNGGAYIPPGIAAPAGDKYRDGYKHLLISESTNPPDFFPWMLEHFVAGIPFKRRPRITADRQDAFYEWTSEARCAKASLRRAVSTLSDKGYLASHRWRTPHERRQNWSTIAWGYALAPSYVEIAKKHALEISTDMVEIVCGMLEQTGRGLRWWLQGQISMTDHLRSLARLNRGSVTRSPAGDKVTVKESVTTLNAMKQVTDTGSITESPRGAGVTVNPDGSLEVRG